MRIKQAYKQKHEAPSNTMLATKNARKYKTKLNTKQRKMQEEPAMQGLLHNKVNVIYNQEHLPCMQTTLNP